MGYICDIKSLKIIFNNDIEEAVLKISNDDNELSRVAKKINLYDNEEYFYENILKIVNIKCPLFHCSLKFNNKTAIMLENLNRFNGAFGVNLNNNINLIIKIVCKISDMHNRFLFYENKNILKSMENLLKINEIHYFKELIDNRFEMFLNINNFLLNAKNKKLLNDIFMNYS